MKYPLSRRTFTRSLLASSLIPGTHQTVNAANAQHLNPKFAQNIDAPDGAMDAAEYFSRMQCQDSHHSTYSYFLAMHPNHQRIFPFFAFSGWQRDEFKSRGPRPAKATDVKTIDFWRCPTDEEVYRNVYQVSLVQEFDNAKTANTRIHMVRFHTNNLETWVWLLNETQDDMYQTFRTYDQRLHVEQAKNAPWQMETISAETRLDIHTLPETLTINAEIAVRHNAPGNPANPQSKAVKYRDQNDKEVAHIRQRGSLAPNLPYITLHHELTDNMGGEHTNQLQSWNSHPEIGQPWALFGDRQGEESALLILAFESSMITVSAKSTTMLEVICQEMAHLGS